MRFSGNSVAGFFIYLLIDGFRSAIAEAILEAERLSSRHRHV
jgi:hypothetical protein